jgi:hypothetical protein
MKISISKFTAWSIAGLLAAVSIAAMASPFLGSKSDPHGTLYLNVDQRAKQIYPVNIWMVDGKLTNRSDQGVLWVTPGDYTFTFKMKAVNQADAPGLVRDSGSQKDQPHELKVTVEAGKAYYIGGKLGASGTWEPVVWQTEDQKN